MPLLSRRSPDEATRLACEVDALAVAHSATLYKVAHSVLRNGDAARDVVQEVFVRVLRHGAKLDGVVDRRVWLVRIAWNLALDQKKRRREEQLEAPFAAQLVTPEATAEQRMQQREQFEAILRAIDRLPAAERQALLLTTVEELGTAEIGKIMGRSEPAIRGLVYRARTRLQGTLEGDI